MKKKGNRSIPDFSRKRPSAPNIPLNQQAPPTHARVAPPAPVVKPHSTSSKSGRRGSKLEARHDQNVTSKTPAVT